MNSSRSHRSGRRHTAPRAAVLAVFLVVPLTACAPGPAPLPTGTAGTGTDSATPTVPPTAGPAITIESPVADSPVTIPVTARGTAGTTEAALVIDLLDEAGQPLCVRHLTATTGSGTAATWQSDLAFPPPEDEETVTLRAYELGADGSESNVVERSLSLTTERPPIIITTPACGASVAPGGTLQVTGLAMVPEAQFTLELRDPAGAAVLTQQVMAASGTEESEFSSTLAVPAGLTGGFYDLVGFDNSLKDGSVQYEFPVQLLVQ